MIPELRFLHFDPCCVPTPHLSPPAHCLHFSLLQTVWRILVQASLSMWESPGQTPEVGEAMHHGASALGFSGHWDFPKWGCRSCFSSLFVSRRGEVGIWAEVDGQYDGERNSLHRMRTGMWVGGFLEKSKGKRPSEMEEVNVRNNQSCCEGEGEGLGISSKSEKEN